jgi:hypothetical protein
MKQLLLSVVSILFVVCLMNVLPACPPAATPPTAAFTATPVYGNAPLTVQFTDQSTPGSSAMTAWAWDFGDGSSSTAQNPVHIYGRAGTFTVTLTVTAAGTDTETKAGFITAGADPNWAANETVFDATIADNVVIVEEADVDRLISGWNEEFRAYQLDSAVADELGLDLQVGDPILLAGQDIRRVSMVEEDAEGIYIETESIPLNEVFTDGEISWDYGIEFTPDIIKFIEIPGVGEFPVKAGTPIEISFDIGALHYDLKVTLDTETADFEFVVTKGIAGQVKGKFTAKGQIARFRSKDQMLFDSGELQQFGHELNGMRGQANLELAVTASGNDFIDYKLPVPIMKIPFVAGVVPVVVSVGVQFVINASVPLDGSALVKTSFSYDSDLGLSFDGVTTQAGGRMGDTTFGDAQHQTGSSSAISANFGIGFPRVTVSIAADTLVPWAQTAFLIGGSYTFTPACQTADAQFIGAVGYDFGILGFNLAKGSKTLFQEKKELLRAGDCDKSESAEEAAMLLEGWEPLLLGN